jgi:hypothetical protein
MPNCDLQTTESGPDAIPGMLAAWDTLGKHDPGLITTLPATIHAVPYETIARDLFIAAAVMAMINADPKAFYGTIAEQAILQADAVMKARAK